MDICLLSTHKHAWKNSEKSETKIAKSDNVQAKKSSRHPLHHVTGRATRQEQAQEFVVFFDFFAPKNICQTRKNNGHLLSNFQRPRRLNQALKYETTKAKKLLNLILSSYLRTLTCGRHRSVRILFLVYMYILILPPQSHNLPT